MLVVVVVVCEVGGCGGVVGLLGRVTPDGLRAAVGRVKNTRPPRFALGAGFAAVVAVGFLGSSTSVVVAKNDSPRLFKPGRALLD